MALRDLVFGIVLLGAAHSAWAAAPSDVIARETGLGTRYFNAQGFSLYTYAHDPAGQSTCVERCAKAWPPLIAAENAQAAGDWTLIARPDGAARQWAYKGHPLYTFARDAAPGSTMGDGVQEVWRLAVDLAPRPKSIMFQGTLSGWVVATTDGATLYMHEGETDTGAHRCTEACARQWKPAAAPVVANPVGDWSVVMRPDGIAQWAFRHHPLYAFAGDAAPGDMRGDGVDGKWHAMVIEPAPGLPQGVRLGPSDYGAILTDARGMTLYSIGDYTRISKTLCLESCLKTYWRPFGAPTDAKPIGNWSVLPGPDGQPQWAYRGRLVFTHTRDTRPGDIEGDRFADGLADFGWDVIQATTLVGHSF
jgi:predicted lipoprotein with Yx(FWY)xxD motif